MTRTQVSTEPSALLHQEKSRIGLDYSTVLLSAYLLSREANEKSTEKILFQIPRRVISSSLVSTYHLHAPTAQIVSVFFERIPR